MTEGACWRLVRLASLGAVAVSLVSSLGSFAAHGAPPGGAPPEGSGPLQLEGYVRVIQGDTLDARSVRGRVAIGIIGVRTPLGNTPCGREATAFVQGLLSDGAWVEEEAGLVVDARLRRMYHVNTPDGRSVAAELVGAGLAWADGQGTTREELAELQTEAREAKRGCLWKSGAIR